jgi:hypothetical protein
MAHCTTPWPTFQGTVISVQQADFISQLLQRFSGLSRTELAATLCEQLGWLRPSGQPKTVECRQWLEVLATHGLIQLPQRRAGRLRGSITRNAVSVPLPRVTAESLAQVAPVSLERVSGPAEQAQWRGMVQQHHPQGCPMPFGAALRYRIQSAQGLLGGLQFSSPAWRLHERDRWIGWTETQRRQGLQHIVCNSRFLILPSVRVPHLASHVLARAARQLQVDWLETFGVRPLLLETLVDPVQYRGTCYAAANWQALGLTSGRGRDDRRHQRHGAAPKQVWVYPLCPDARQRLCGVAS